MTAPAADDEMPDVIYATKTRQGPHASNGSWSSSADRLDNKGDRHKANRTQYTRTAGDVSLLLEALEKSNAAMWDAHYGKGIAVKYARAVDAEVKAALAKFAGGGK